MSYISDIVPVETDCAVGIQNILSYAEKCQFVQNNSDCYSTGFFKYSFFIYCQLSEELRWIGMISMVILLIVLFLGLSTAADSFFCPCISVIVEHLGLSHNIAGVTFLAFGNGAPDIFAALASVMNSENPAGLAFGALLGAGMFLSTIIVGIVTLIRPFNVMQRPLLRDLVFYLFTLYWVFYILYKRRIRLFDSVGFLLLYVVYVLVVVGGRYVRKKMQSRAQAEAKRNLGTPMNGQHRPKMDAGAAEDDLETDDEFAKYDLFMSSRRGGNASSSNGVGTDDILTVDSVSIAGSDVGLIVDVKETRGFVNTFLHSLAPFTVEEWRYANYANRALLIAKAPLLVFMKLTVPTTGGDRWSSVLPLVQCFLCPIFALVALKYVGFYIGGVFPVAIISLVVSTVVAAILAYTSRLDEPPRYRVLFAYLGFGMSVIWIYCLAREVVNILRIFGVVLNLSHEILGLTVLAWSNSLGDLVSDVTVARQGYPRMAISACFGGPLFNMLVGIGLPFTIATSQSVGHTIPINVSPVAHVLCLFLGVSLISSLLILPLSRFRATRSYATYLIVLYVGFLVVAILTEMKIIHTLW